MFIHLPDTGSQDDTWSCGPNSTARVLKHYGHNVDYATVRATTDRQFLLPSSVKIPNPTWSDPFRTRRVDIRAGTPPHLLRDIMKRWEGDNVKLERKAGFPLLVDLLKDGKPVVVLLRTGSIDASILGTFPELHWVVAVGVNEPEQLIYYSDTNSTTYQLSYDDFMNKWSWRIGDGLASEILWKEGVKTETIIWIDRQP
ncbi:C39 family peptidase [Pseudanabaena sp. PCC 6802]|uniref:C39 family peptidase n=1 Tax=Pseudanabaena sp. PCC 6802 TaxID=118173 RepID=UPI00036373E8|nr:C39 family peptidase [Pseudanabaena sp. PCC 6802]